jgi:hypothetical protein
MKAFFHASRSSCCNVLWSEVYSPFSQLSHIRKYFIDFDVAELQLLDPERELAIGAILPAVRNIQLAG